MIASDAGRAGDRALVVSTGHGLAAVPVDAQGNIEWTLDQIIMAWLTAKYDKSKSVRTRAAYAKGLATYRALLQPIGLDLDSPDTTALAACLEGWAGTTRQDGRDISASVHNQRIAIVSSFYAYARKKGYALLKDVASPADRVDRAKVQAYARVKFLPAKAVKAKMTAIDRATLKGARDYALLAVGLRTGRRLSEIAALRRRDLSVDDGIVTLVFAHAKGGMVWQNTLDKETSGALLAWLATFYGDAAPDGMAGDAPIWVSLARGSRRQTHERADGERGEPLGIQSIADLCRRRLGVSKVHALRHSFAHQLEARHAKVSEIQAALGHASIATTGIYLASLNSGVNEHGDELADDFGITASPVAPSLRTRHAPITRPLASGAKDGRA